MAKLYLTEYGNLPGSGAQVGQEPAIVEQATLAIGSETKSSAFSDNTRIIRVHVDAICSIAFGTSPTATTSSKRMAADQTEYFCVRPGDKLSVISNT